MRFFAVAPREFIEEHPGWLPVAFVILLAAGLRLAGWVAHEVSRTDGSVSLREETRQGIGAEA